MPVPPPVSGAPIVDSTRRLLAAVKKLERSLHTVGLPRFVARMPVWWLCWYYCRMLHRKTERMRCIARKFERWLPAIEAAGQDKLARLEFIDMDHGMRDDIEVSKRTMQDLRNYCIDIARIFGQLGYQSARLQQGQAVFVAVVESSCRAASAMQAAVSAHDAAVLARLQALRVPAPEPEPEPEPEPAPVLLQVATSVPLPG